MSDTPEEKNTCAIHNINSMVNKYYPGENFSYFFASSWLLSRLLVLGNEHLFYKNIKGLTEKGTEFWHKAIKHAKKFKKNNGENKLALLDEDALEKLDFYEKIKSYQSEKNLYFGLFYQEDLVKNPLPIPLISRLQEHEKLSKIHEGSFNRNVKFKDYLEDFTSRKSLEKPPSSILPKDFETYYQNLIASIDNFKKYLEDIASIAEFNQYQTDLITSINNIKEHIDTHLIDIPIDTKVSTQDFRKTADNLTTGSANLEDTSLDISLDITVKRDARMENLKKSPAQYREPPNLAPLVEFRNYLDSLASIVEFKNNSASLEEFQEKLNNFAAIYNLKDYLDILVSTIDSCGQLEENIGILLSHKHHAMAMSYLPQVGWKAFDPSTYEFSFFSPKETEELAKKIMQAFDQDAFSISVITAVDYLWKKENQEDFKEFKEKNLQNKFSSFFQGNSELIEKLERKKSFRKISQVFKKNAPPSPQVTTNTRVYKKDLLSTPAGEAAVAAGLINQTTYNAIPSYKRLEAKEIYDLNEYFTVAEKDPQSFKLLFSTGAKSLLKAKKTSFEALLTLTPEERNSLQAVFMPDGVTACELGILSIDDFLKLPVYIRLSCKEKITEYLIEIYLQFTADLQMRSSSKGGLKAVQEKLLSIFTADPQNLRFLFSENGLEAVQEKWVSLKEYIDIPLEKRPLTEFLFDQPLILAAIKKSGIPLKDLIVLPQETLQALPSLLNSLYAVAFGTSLLSWENLIRLSQEELEALVALLNSPDAVAFGKSLLSWENLIQLPEEELKALAGLFNSPDAVIAFRTGLLSWEDYKAIPFAERTREGVTILDFLSYFKVPANDPEGLCWLITEEGLAALKDKVISIKFYIKDIPLASRKSFSYLFSANGRMALKENTQDNLKYFRKTPFHKRKSMVDLLFSSEGLVAVKKGLLTGKEFPNIPEEELLQAKGILDLHKYFKIPKDDPNHLRRLLLTSQGLAVIKTKLLSLKDFFEIPGEDLAAAKGVYDLYSHFKTPTSEEDPEALGRLFPLKPIFKEGALASISSFFTSNKKQIDAKEKLSVLREGIVDLDEYINTLSEERKSLYLFCLNLRKSLIETGIKNLEQFFDLPRGSRVERMKILSNYFKKLDDKSAQNDDPYQLHYLFSPEGIKVINKGLMSLEQYFAINRKKEILSILNDYITNPQDDSKHLGRLLYTKEGLFVMRAKLLSLEDFVNIPEIELEAAKTVFDLHRHFKPSPEHDSEDLWRLFKPNLGFHHGIVLQKGLIDLDDYLNTPRRKREKLCILCLSLYKKLSQLGIRNFKQFLSAPNNWRLRNMEILDGYFYDLERKSLERNSAESSEISSPLTSGSSSSGVSTRSSSSGSTEASSSSSSQKSSERKSPREDHELLSALFSQKGLLVAKAGLLSLQQFFDIPKDRRSQIIETLYNYIVNRGDDAEKLSAFFSREGKLLRSSGFMRVDEFLDIPPYIREAAIKQIYEFISEGKVDPQVLRLIFFVQKGNEGESKGFLSLEQFFTIPDSMRREAISIAYDYIKKPEKDRAALKLLLSKEGLIAMQRANINLKHFRTLPEAKHMDYLKRCLKFDAQESDLGSYRTHFRQ